MKSLFLSYFPNSSHIQLLHGISLTEPLVLTDHDYTVYKPGYQFGEVDVEHAELGGGGQESL